MDNETKKMFRTLGFLSTIGMTMAFSIGLGALAGYYLDKKFASAPWFFIIFLIFGIIAAFKNLHMVYKKTKDL
ncbi:AtpZ/AtpI family protein [Thermodesulfobacteriota bacterium]